MKLMDNTAPLLLKRKASSGLSRGMNMTSTSFLDMCDNERVYYIIK